MQNISRRYGRDNIRAYSSPHQGGLQKARDGFKTGRQSVLIFNLKLVPTMTAVGSLF
jgi:hypothetical protein